MNKKKLIDKLGYGCGGYWGMPTFPFKKANDLIATAINHGVKYFDTGHHYSFYNAETRMGTCLKKKRDSLFIGSKAGTKLNLFNQAKKDFSYDFLKNSASISVQNLGGKLDLIQLHSPRMCDVMDDKVKYALYDLKRVYANNIGISCNDDILDYVIDNYNLDYIMLTYNILHTHTYDAIKKAKDKGIKVMIKTPMAHNIGGTKEISGLKDFWYFLKNRKHHRLKKLADELMEKYKNITSDNFRSISLEYAITDPLIDVVFIGTCSKKHLIQNIEFVKSLNETVRVEQLTLPHQPEQNNSHRLQNYLTSVPLVDSCKL